MKAVPTQKVEKGLSLINITECHSRSWYVFFIGQRTTDEDNTQHARGERQGGLGYTYS